MYSIRLSIKTKFNSNVFHFSYLLSFSYYYDIYILNIKYNKLLFKCTFDCSDSFSNIYCTFFPLLGCHSSLLKDGAMVGGNLSSYGFGPTEAVCTKRCICDERLGLLWILNRNRGRRRRRVGSWTATAVCCPNGKNRFKNFPGKCRGPWLSTGPIVPCET